MSLRYFSLRMFRNGRHLLQKLVYSNISESSVYPAKVIVNPDAGRLQSVARYSALKNVGISVGSHARRLFIDNVLRKVSSGINSHVRQQVKKRLLFGDAAPLFSFVGISLASGSGILTREDEQEGLCWEIRNAVSKFQWTMVTEDAFESLFTNDVFSLENLEIGNPIAKGCSAVVYGAKIKEPSAPATSADLLGNVPQKLADEPVSSSNSIVEYPFALKMLFNYDIQSSSMAILKGMYQETVPAIKCKSNPETSSWESLFENNNVSLPPHPNIVTMYTAFADYIPHLPGSKQMYPDALPPRIYTDGSGRNMTLFLLMKRYECSLDEYLKNNTPEIRESILILAQLLEGITHINMHGVAHRDLKCDNILIDRSTLDSDDSVPVLVLTDFGCCLADKSNGLRIPYRTEQLDKGGNVALMAPEIITQTHGHFSFLDYSKSDLWAAGTIAYEIFGSPNPFYSNNLGKDKILRNCNYQECDLPELGDKVPLLVKKLISNMLKRNPNQRLSPEVAANVCQLYLWCPSAWLKSERLPGSQEILQWLLCLTSKVLCEARLGTSLLGQTVVKKSIRRSHTEYVLISSFLSRAKLVLIRQALAWIHSNS